MSSRLAFVRGSQGIRGLPATALAVAAILVMLATTSASADTKSGTFGHYAVTDTSGRPGVTCSYTSSYPNHYLVSMTVRAPSVWWPNTTSANDTENGLVGWWPVVQRQTNSGWKTVADEAAQQATAYEDRPLKDPADRAPFSSRTVAVSASDNELYRVIVKVAWYATDASVMGSARHTVKRYRLTYPGWSSATTGGCSGRLTILT
jgi:hypothetical protein